MKNGTTRQKVQRHALAEWMERHSHVQSLAMELVHDVAQGRFVDIAEQADPHRRPLFPDHELPLRSVGACHNGGC